MLKRRYFTVAAMTLFGLVGILEVQADPIEEPVTWGGVYFAVGAGAGSLSYDAFGHATKSRLSDTRTCGGKKGRCSDPTPWVIWQPGDFEYDLAGIEPHYNYSKEIHASGDDWNIFGTVQVGIDYQIGQSFVVGVFADYDFYKDDGGSFSVSWVNPDPGDETYERGSLSGNAKLDDVWSIGGRIGVLVTPRFLLYGVGGYTQASLDANATFMLRDDLGAQTLSVNLSDELHTYFVGAGGEIKFSDSMAVKVEYRYSDFAGEIARASKIDQTSKFICGSFEDRVTRHRAMDVGLDAELHSVRAVLVFRLGGGDEGIQPLK